MMNTCWIEHLSNELLLEIFQYLHLPRLLRRQRYLFSCILVNRRWHDLALPLLWRSIHLDLFWYNFTEIGLFDADGGLYDYPIRMRDRNELGVRPVQPELLTRSLQRQQFKVHPLKNALSFCRYISICARDNTWSDNLTFDIQLDTLDVMSVVLACNNLRDVDIYLRTSQEPTYEFRRMWAKIAEHLANLSLSTFSLHIDSLSFPLIPAAFGFDGSPISFNLIADQITHLSLTQRMQVLTPVFEGGLKCFRNLVSLEFLLETGRGAYGSEDDGGVEPPSIVLPPFS